MKFGIYNKPEVTVYLGTYFTEYNDKGQLVSNIADQGLYGTVCRIINEENGWAHIVSSYGYAGYLQTKDIILTDEEGALAWLDNAAVTNAVCTDVLTAPTVHGAAVVSLPKGSLAIPTGDITEGWMKVRLADSTEGYVPKVHLDVKRFGNELLFEDPEDLIDRQDNAVKLRDTETGGQNGFCFAEVLDKWFDGSEEKFRSALTRTAESYLGTQYRWAGRSSFGIDCSGLVGMCYLLNGVVIYRDASIVRDYPIKRLELKWNEGHFDLSNLEGDNMRPGDLLYFPGHVAMYLTDGMYIHSTGRAGSNAVVYNSLKPEHELFRQDLLDSLYAVGGLRREE